MNPFDLMLATIGGALIGLAASGLLFSVGRIAGISGIVGGLLKPAGGDVAWRITFILGLLMGGVALALSGAEVFAAPADRSLWAVAIAGLLVGFGVRMGNGCTSGHGVCGLTRRSRRSLAATAMFMATGALTATIIEFFKGGVL